MRKGRVGCTPSRSLSSVTGGQSPGVSREKEEIRFYLLAAACPELVTILSRAWKTPVRLQST